MGDREFPLMHRFIDVPKVKRATDAGDLTVELALASEYPVQRFYGNEVLDMGKKSVRLQRMNDGASLLFNHNTDEVRGSHVPNSVRVDGDKVLRGKVRITAATQAGRDAIGLVEGGHLTKASIGYSIHKVVEQTKRGGKSVERTLDGRLFERAIRATAEEGGDVNVFRRALDASTGPFERDMNEEVTYRIIDWEPYETSLVTTPADPTVGIGRSKDPPPTKSDETKPAQAGFFSPDAAVRDATSPTAPNATKGATRMSAENTAAATATADHSNDGTQLERLRIRTISDLCRQHKIDEKTRDEWIDAGLTVDVASSKVLDMLAERGRSAPAQDARVGLSTKEVRSYSLHRAVSSILGHGNWDKAGLEFEAHKAIRDKLNKDCGKNSFYVPVEVQERSVATHEKRDLTVATTSAGGYLVETSNQGFIDILRNRSVIMAMGARRLTGLQGNLTVPKQSGAATAYWLSTESTSITEGALTFGQLALSPKNVGAYVEISRQLLLQSSPSAEQVTMTDLAAQLGLAVDTAGITGTGASGQPTGILNTSGIGSSASGTTLGYTGLISMQSDVAGANALTQSCGYVTTPAVAGLLMGRQRFSNTNTPVWDGNMLDAQAAGFRAMSSNQMPSAKMIFGDFNQLIVAEWGVLEVEVNPVANFQAGIVGVRAIYSVDIGVRYAGAFSSVASIT